MRDLIRLLVTNVRVRLAERRRRRAAQDRPPDIVAELRAVLLIGDTSRR